MTDPTADAFAAVLRHDTLLRDALAQARAAITTPLTTEQVATAMLLILHEHGITYRRIQGYVAGVAPLCAERDPERVFVGPNKQAIYPWRWHRPTNAQTPVATAPDDIAAMSDADLDKALEIEVNRDPNSARSDALVDEQIRRERLAQGMQGDNVEDSDW